MNERSEKAVFAMAAFTLALVVAIGVSAPSAAAQAPGQKIEEAFKNIQSLKGQPADMLNPTMVYFEAALGVGCPFCHDPDGNKREADTNPRKVTARRMIEMVNTINANTFAGAKQVNCMTCHQGRSKPIGVPVVAGTQLPAALGDDFERVRPKPISIPTSITVDQIFDKYLAAMGGPSALERVPSLTARGTITQRRPGRDFPAVPVEISTKAQGMELLATGAGQNQNLTSYSGAAGWARGGQGNPRDLRRAEADALKLEDAFNLPGQLKRLIVDAKVSNPESFGGRELYVVTGRTQNLPFVKLWFEKDSGMLARLLYHVDSLFGVYPTRIEYGDFREIDGRKVPYSWRIAQSRNREFTWTMDNVQAAAVDDSKFAKPAGR